jgi:hypothetical protein
MMDEFIKLLDQSLNYVSHEIIGDTIFILVLSNRPKVICLYCEKPSAKAHSHYERRFQNMQMQGKKAHKNPHC